MSGEHVAEQIIAAVETKLALVGTVHRVPIDTVDISGLPAIFLSEIEDETVQEIGRGPLAETHKMQFEVFGAVVATSGFSAAAGVLRANIEKALMEDSADLTLSGLCRPGLRRPVAAFRVDSEALQKPVGGWALRFVCQYQLNTAAPATPI